MITEIITYIIVPIGMLIGIVLYKLLYGIIKHRRGIKKTSSSNEYSQRISEYAKDLLRSASSIDHVINDMSIVMQDKLNAVKQLENQLSGLVELEQSLKDRIRIETDTPPPAVAEIIRTINQINSRTGKRDLLFLVIGIVSSALISILLGIIFKQ